MNKISKAIITILMTAAMVTSLTACKTTSTTDKDTEMKDSVKNREAKTTEVKTSEKKKYKIGFALQTEDVQVFSTMSDGMKARADKLGVDYTCLVANGDTAAQISNIENMIAQNYDAIIVHAFDKEAFGDVVKQALAKNIVICAYDDSIIDSATGKPCNYQLSFLCDNYQIGYRVGKMATDWTLATFGKEEKELQFGIMQHKEYQIHQERVKGMKDAIAKYDPRITIVDEQEGLVTEDGVSACEAWSQAYPNLRGVLSTNDTTLLGYAEAWKAAGKDVNDKKFGMFGNDGVKDAIDIVASGGIIRGDVGLDVFSGGGDALEACYNVLNGEPAKDVLMPMIDVTFETAQKWTGDPNLYR